MPPKNILARISTPGRICLFGEHQDYLELPVISSAISLRLSIDACPRPDSTILIHAPDVRRDFSIDLCASGRNDSRQDFFRSTLKVLRDAGLTFSRGLECTVHGEIPISAGTSSSSAMIVSWVNLLGRVSDQQREFSPHECATLAYAAEVIEFQGSGGQMDQYATALGGVLFQSYHPSVRIERLTPKLGTFVLGDSEEPKDTQRILSEVKERVLSIVRKLSSRSPEFSLQTVMGEDLHRYAGDLDAHGKALLPATIRNRDITRLGQTILSASSLDARAFGELLNEQHSILRDSLCISTPKIDRMLEASLSAGALGGKINGSGGGGCMFVYAPAGPEQVAEAIERMGGKAYIVHVDDGTRAETVGEEG